MSKKWTLVQITAQIDQLQRQAELLRAKHKRSVLNAILDAMAQYGISYEELHAARRNGSDVRVTAAPAGAVRPGKRVPPKYRNPKTGETWSGRGRTARWIVEAEREGRSRDKFLIR